MKDLLATSLIFLYFLTPSDAFVTSSLVTTANNKDGKLFSTLVASPIIGEADTAFRQGIQLEKTGHARASSVSFHEAATLYQCLLETITTSSSSNDEYGDSQNNQFLVEDEGAFSYVTSIPKEEIPSILAYTCFRLAHLTHDALGDSKAACRLYKEATMKISFPMNKKRRRQRKEEKQQHDQQLQKQPSCLSDSFLGLGTCIEASGGSLYEAIEAYRQALHVDNNNLIALFQLAVALERTGNVDESDQYMEQLRRADIMYSCLVDSWGYVRWHTRKVKNKIKNIHRGTFEMLQIGLEAASPLIKDKNSLVCEFGVSSGRSLRMIQELLPLDVPVHGFDTFLGLPQTWNNEPIGAFSTGGLLPPVSSGDVRFHQGLFKDTIPQFAKNELPNNGKNNFIAFANLDCHLYSSTLDVLENLHGFIVPGTVLVFNSYLCHPTWRQNEFRVWREICKRFGYKYEYLGFSLSTKQTVIRVTDA